MAKWVVDQLILEMCRKNISIKSSNILILGFSFKENCPDIRNTKVLDIIKALDCFGIEYDIVDPWVERKEAKNIYSIDVKNEINFSNSYEGIICTVAHNEFINISIDQWRSLIVENGIIFDVKGFLPREINAERI